MFILSTTELLKHVESRFSISIEPSVPIRFVHITNVVSGQFDGVQKDITQEMTMHRIFHSLLTHF